MARVTIEDCKEKINDRFKLVVLAAFRAKKIAQGSPAFIAAEGEKNKESKGPVLALREIAQGAMNCQKAEEEMISSCQSYSLRRQLSEINQKKSDDNNRIISSSSIHNEVHDLFQSIIEEENTSNSMTTSHQAESKIYQDNIVEDELL